VVEGPKLDDIRVAGKVVAVYHRVYREGGKDAFLKREKRYFSKMNTFSTGGRSNA
jgi:hypothetical protein